MFVAATSRCFCGLSLDAALLQLVELEYTCVEIMVHERGGHLKPSEVLADSETAIAQCRQTHRLTPRRSASRPNAPRAVVLPAVRRVLPIGQGRQGGHAHGPFGRTGHSVQCGNRAAAGSGRVGLAGGRPRGCLTEGGRMTENPDTAVVLCNNVKGLGITLDPSHFICGPHRGGNYEQLMKYVYHVRLATPPRTRSRCGVGQGDVEYGRLVNQLNKVHYDRALCVDALPRRRWINSPRCARSGCCWRVCYSKKTNEGRSRLHGTAPLGSRSGELRGRFAASLCSDVWHSRPRLCESAYTAEGGCATSARRSWLLLHRLVVSFLTLILHRLVDRFHDFVDAAAQLL